MATTCFVVPPSAPADAYDIDANIAPGAVWRMRVPLMTTGEIALQGADGLSVVSNNPDVVPNGFRERTERGLRILTIRGQQVGVSLVKAGPSASAPLLQVVVGGAQRFAPSVLRILNGFKNHQVKTNALAAMDDPAVQKIKLSLDGITIQPSSYASVKDKINSGGITVRFDDTLTSTQAKYSPFSNTLAAGFIVADDAHQALLIHEATHAACDIAKVRVTPTLTSEILAYVAQAIYMRIKLPNLNLQSDPIRGNAELLAQIVLNGGQLDYKKNLVNIMDALDKDPTYKSQARTIDYDGVP